LALCWMAAVRRHSRKLHSAAILAVVLISFASWFAVRTWLLTGDPGYPQTAAYSVHVPKAVHSLRGVIQRYAGSIVNAHFAGKIMFPSPTENPLGMALIMLMPAWFAGGLPRNRNWWI